jgi:hypothetical protein
VRRRIAQLGAEIELIPAMKPWLAFEIYSRNICQPAGSRLLTPHAQSYPSNMSILIDEAKLK